VIVGPVVRFLLGLLSLRICYVCEWGEYDYAYDTVDLISGRPIHEGMSVAPPWAVMRVKRVEK
jgi:hypothetical protein